MRLPFAVAALTLLLPVHAAAIPEGDFHLHASGNAASADWLTAEAGAGPGGLDLITATNILAGEHVTKANHDKSTQVTANLFQVSYSFTPEGEFLLVGFRFGSAVVADFEMGSNLKAASLDATFGVLECVATGDFEFSCNPGPDVAVQVTWTATDKRSRDSWSSHFSEEGIRIDERASEKFRPAAATGTMDGVSKGPADGARLSDTHQMLKVDCTVC